MAVLDNLPSAKPADIPTKTSQLINDSDFVTKNLLGAQVTYEDDGETLDIVPLETAAE